MIKFFNKIRYNHMENPSTECVGVDKANCHSALDTESILILKCIPASAGMTESF